MFVFSFSFFLFAQPLLLHIMYWGLGLLLQANKIKKKKICFFPQHVGMKESRSDRCSFILESKTAEDVYAVFDFDMDLYMYGEKEQKKKSKKKKKIISDVDVRWSHKKKKKYNVLPRTRRRRRQIA